MKMFDPQTGIPSIIPSDATKVFSGVVFDVYQWQQKLFDGSFGTFEIIKRRNTCVVLAIMEDKKIILIEDENPFKKIRFVALPEGRAEPDETPIETAKRELEEETGFISENFLPWFVFPSTQTKLEWNQYFFVAKNCVLGGNGQKQDAGENIKLKFVSFDEFIEMVKNGTIRDTEILETFAEKNLDLTEEKIEEMRRMVFNQ
ncbi:MAG: NUDIX hydrolase [Patescibacteria group bacterium]